MNKLTSFLLCSFILLTSNAAHAAAKPIKFKLRSSLGSGYSVLAISTDGKASTADITSKSVSVVPPASSSLIYILDSGNKVAYQVVNKYCTKAKTGVNKGKYTSCSRKSLVSTVFKAGANLGTLKTLDGALLANLNGTKYKTYVVARTTAAASNWVPTGIATHGLAPRSTATRIKANRFGTKAATGDEDADGLVDAVDSDDDGDSVLDNYDSSSTPSSSESSFNVFSNLKLELDQSINYHTTGLSTAQIDTALQSVQTLAIQVAGATSATVELDCGALSYCSAGGTGTNNSSAFPGTAGGAVDPDSDGFGTITRGGTGDFQLKTGATASAIGGGDTFVQYVTDGSTETKVPGMLNFVFNSNPALKEVTVNSNSPVTLSYAVTPIAGSRQNCFSAPSTGDVSLTITGYRPQRPGDSAAGEAEYVDIGKSLIVMDIPNGACASPNGSCAAQGPGNCIVSSYSTSDSNLTVGTNGLEDGKSDTDADSSNTYTFTFDLTSCLANTRSSPVSWNAGETIFVDLQFKSADGDNAAQKFCVTRAP